MYLGPSSLGRRKQHVVEEETVFNTSILLTTNFITGSLYASFPTYAVIEN